MVRLYTNPASQRQGDGRKNGKPKFVASILKLYRSNDTWRGALDLTFIGSLVLCLAFGFPDIGHWVNSAFLTGKQEEARPSPDENKAPSAAPASSTSLRAPAVGANFSPAPIAPRNNLPAPSTIPPNAQKVGGLKDPVWINSPSEEDLAILNKASALLNTDNASAINLVKEKAESGDPNYQFILATLYEGESFDDKSVDASLGIDKSIYWLKESASQGHPAAQYELGQIYRLGPKNFHRDIGEAIKWYEMASNNPNEKKGEPENELGRLYESGTFVKKDIRKAFDYFSRGAEKGNHYAQANLGVFYYNGEAVPRDLGKAKLWLEKAAQQGDMNAQMNLALMYNKGKIGNSPNYPEFLKWAGFAADNGNIEAMIALGDFYRYGKPEFEADQKMAAKFYRQAALKKNPKAQFLFAEMYEQGLGVPKDLIQSYVYYNLAYENAYTPAISAFKSLKARMSPAELEYAEKMTKALATPEAP